MTWGDANAWEEQLIADVRANGGTPSQGPLAGHPIGILYTTGAKSGERRRSIVTYSRDGDDYLIAGTNNSRPKNPAWVANIAANPNVEIEIANEEFPVRGELLRGDDRERAWKQHVEQLPWFGKYEETITGREIPVVRLRRTA